MLSQNLQVLMRILPEHILVNKQAIIIFKILKKECKGLADKRTVERNRLQSKLQNVPFTYTGESKRSWKSWGAEHKPGKNGNIGSTVKQNMEVRWPHG